MRKIKIEPGDVVQIVGMTTRKPIQQPPVYGLVIDWAYSKQGEDYWSCIWSNGMSSDTHAASCELEVICEARNE